MNTVLFAGGGSGGHLFPGVAVAEQLLCQSPRSSIRFLGSDREIERRILKRSGFEHIPLRVSSSSQLLRSPVSFVLRNWRAFWQAKRILLSDSPSVVVGLGGFASVPVVLAAWRLKIPIILLEQNAVLGRANRFLLPFANQICVSFDQTPIPARYASRIRRTGNPVRADVAATMTTRTEPAKPPFTLAVLGGSQGASSVNESFLLALTGLRSELGNWKILHQTGSQQFQDVQDRYAKLGIAAEVAPFFNDMGSRYPRIDIVISRAGGTTLAELAMHAIPAVLIPYPKSIRDHQLRNAEQVERAGGGLVVPQSSHPDQTAEQLASVLKPLLTLSDRRANMAASMRSLAKPDAAVSVANLILEYSQSREDTRDGISTQPTAA